MSMWIHFGLLTDLYMMMCFVNRIRSCLYLLSLRHFGLLSLSLLRFDSLALSDNDVLVESDKLVLVDVLVLPDVD